MASHGKVSHLLGARSIPSSTPAFSGYNVDRGDEEDGFLTAGEVMALELRAVDLAVLSACQTAEGAVRGYEGKFGLERAFFVAGVKTFVGSLWHVDDRATSEFMARFYTKLRDGMEKSEALRQTKLDFVSGSVALSKSKGERGIGLKKRTVKNAQALTHPYYWAAFILSGDGSRVSADRTR